MGTSSSGGGAKGRTPLLPSWATGSAGTPRRMPDDSDNKDDGNENDSLSGPDEKEESGKKPDKEAKSPKPELTSDWTPAKSSFTRFVTGGGGAQAFRKAANSYVRSIGGSAKATRSAAKGISIGGGYIEFVGSIRRDGLQLTLEEYGLTDCLGKSTEEALAKVAQKIAPSGTTNDEILARAAVMAAMEALYVKLEEKGEGIEVITQVSEESLKDSVMEYVSAFIFRKWVYELGLALERNELSERQAIELEGQVKNLVRDEVKSALRSQNILRLDFQKGNGRRVIENIFSLAYSTLEK